MVEQVSLYSLPENWRTLEKGKLLSARECIQWMHRKEIQPMTLDEAVNRYTRNIVFVMPDGLQEEQASKERYFNIVHFRIPGMVYTHPQTPEKGVLIRNAAIMESYQLTETGPTLLHSKEQPKEFGLHAGYLFWPDEKHFNRDERRLH